MLTEWYINRIKDHTMKLWRYEAVVPSSSNNLGKMFIWSQLLEETKMLFDGVVGTLPKILEAYMDEWRG
jgi:hypothetical protein